jgi:hypothetical protein
MNYCGVAHLFSDNLELHALRLFRKSHHKLDEQQQEAVAKELIRDIAICDTPRDNPQEAWDDAVKLCEAQGLAIGYAMIKREDGMYYTHVSEAQWAIDNGR